MAGPLKGHSYKLRKIDWNEITQKYQIYIFVISRVFEIITHPIT